MLNPLALITNNLSVTFGGTVTLLIAVLLVLQQWQKRRDAIQQETQARWQSVVQMVGNVLICLSSDYHIVEWNQAAEQVYGWQRGEVLGTDYLRLLPEGIRDRVIIHYRHVLDQRTPHRFEHPVFARDGQERFLLWHITPWLDSQGNVLGLIVSGQDITERQQLEERLRLWESLVVSANEAIVITEAEPLEWPGPKVLYVNKAFTRHTGYSEAEIIGQTPRLLQGPKTDRRQIARIRTALKQQQPIQVELINYRKEGSEFWVELNIFPVINPQGQVTHFVSMQRDITKSKNQAVALVEAREAAIKASQSKSQFLAQMSHEIRTPMNGVLGMVELLQRTKLTPQQQDYTRTISYSAKHLLTVINDILDLSKLEAGETQLEHLDFDLDACLGTVVDLLAAKAEEKELELAILMDNNLPRQLNGDAVRLRQVLLNLVSNAIKFTDKGSVVIHGALQFQTNQTIKIRFSVEDTGIGIAPELQPKLFDPFVQGNTATLHNYGGTGLGLSICRQFVKLMGGEIGVESTLGQGSRFWFTAEFDQPNATQPNPVASVFSGLKLLVVDNSPLVRQSVFYVVRPWGIEVSQANTTVAALTALETAMAQGIPYDVVLVDESLLNAESTPFVRVMHQNSAQAQTELTPVPGKSSPNLPVSNASPDQKGIRGMGELGGRVPKSWHTRFILMSRMKQRQRAEQLLKLGDFSYVVKPVTPSRLLNSLVETLRLPLTQTLATAKLERENTLTPTTSNPGVPDDSSSSVSILLAEDDPINQQVILGQLSLLGYPADCVADGQAVLNRLAQQDYDIILMDCQMPVLDGYETTRLLREHEGSDRHTIVLALTASAMSTDREKCLAVGMDDYISKPVELEVLGAVLQRWTIPSQSNGLVRRSDAETTTANLTPHSPTELSCPINLERLNQLFKGKEDYQQKFLKIFIQEAQTGIDLLGQAIATADFASMKQQAHRLKGSSGNAGIYQMPEMAQQLENLADRESLEGTGELLEALLNCLSNLQVFLNNQGFF